MEHSHHPLVDFVSGVCAGVANVLICAPLDTARTCLQVQNLYDKKYTGIYSALSQIYRNEGFLSLYKGISASLVAYPMSWSIYFALYNSIRSFANSKLNNDLLSNVTGASLAGLVGSILTNPF